LRCIALDPWVEREINPRFNLCADDTARSRPDHGRMTTSNYLINAVFVLVVLRQAGERRLDRRSLLIPLLVVFFVAQRYVHTLPTTGNDLVLVALLTALGLGLGLASGFATQLRLRERLVFARIGWLAGTLLITGICARIVFAFAAADGAGPAIRGFSVAHHIGAAAWQVALVAMARARWRLDS
jgi:hypothetical protein